jgi:hypothetical protein
LPTGGRAHPVAQINKESWYVHRNSLYDALAVRLRLALRADDELDVFLTVRDPMYFGLVLSAGQATLDTLRNTRVGFPHG